VIENVHAAGGYLLGRALRLADSRGDRRRAIIATYQA
jgi:hypothetical protein